MGTNSNEFNQDSNRLTQSTLRSVVDEHFQQIDTQSESLTKEVFARFGLAYYESEVLHRGLCHIYVFYSFASKDDVTIPRLEEQFASAYSLTLGKIKEKIESLVPSDFGDVLNKAVEKRNFIAHKFWFERAEQFLTESGKHAMIKELAEYTDFFSNADKMADKLLEPKLKEFGVSNDVLQAALNDIQKGKPWIPFLEARKLKKQECISHVWDVTIPSGSKSLIFETDDGCLWALCDVGLGWTSQIKDASWKEHPEITKYLPANIEPRPRNSEPWQYEFRLSTKAILWVTRGSKPKTFKWGIRNL